MSAQSAKRPRLAVLLSGTGRTLQNLLDRIDDGRLCGCIAGVASDRDDAFGLQRAMDHGIETRVLREPSAIWSWVHELDVDLVLLAGYCRLLPLIPDFDGRVLNIHPSLLPDFGGKGMYGEHVHAAVLSAGRTESGCTVHLCNDRYDDGRILVQARGAGAGGRHTVVAGRTCADRRARGLPGRDRAALAGTASGPLKNSSTHHKRAGRASRHAKAPRNPPIRLRFWAPTCIDDHAPGKQSSSSTGC